MPARNNPLFAAAVLKLSFCQRGNEGTGAFQFVYDGVLRDFGLTDEQVEKYLAENLERVSEAVRGKQ